MKLYEVNEQLEELLSQLEPDPETGEIPANEEEVLAQIQTLAMKREDILQYLAKLALAAKASSQTIRAEEARLKERRTRMDKKQDQLISILDRECGGEKTDLGIATLCYGKTSRIEIQDDEAAFEWLQKKGYTECYRIPKPEIYKANVGKLLDSGNEVPGVKRVFFKYCYLK